MNEQGTILIADDEDTFLDATTELLKEDGFDCFSVRNAEEMVRALKSTDFDLLITDLKMPGNRVLEMVEEIRQQSYALPVIVVTGYPSIPSAVESVRLNVLEYFIKPIEHAKLLEATKRGIQHKRVLRAVRKARQETENRLKRLEDFEQTLGNFSGLAPKSDELEELTLDPQVKELQFQVEGLTRLLDRPGQEENPKAPSTSLMMDYVRLRDGLYETIQVLQKTKGSFHSKDLARLRIYIQDLLRDTKMYDGPSAQDRP